MIIILHKDRLAEISSLLERPSYFAGRWLGVRTPDKEIAFICTAAGRSDVWDCLLHLGAFPPKQLLFTGTCGGLTPEIKIGDICFCRQGWLGGGIKDWLYEENSVLESAIPVSSSIPIPLLKLGEILVQEFHRDVHMEKVFSVPFQALESKKFLNQVQKKGAAIIDMETGGVIALSNQLGIPACLCFGVQIYLYLIPITTIRTIN